MRYLVVDIGRGEGGDCRTNTPGRVNLVSGWGVGCGVGGGGIWGFGGRKGAMKSQ